jgi:RHS repeat-associated protein
VQGQLNTITVPGNRTTTLNYNAAGDLLSVVDPLGNTTLLQPDAVGRVQKTTDPLGFETANQYNPVDQLAEIIDANAGSTKLTYDAKRNLASVINPLNVPIESYQYDTQNRLTQKTDAKGKSTGYQYDTAGNLTQMTDRRSQLTTLAYDDQNRPVQIAFSDATQTRAYDAAGRLTEVREGSSSIQTSYDDADRVVRVITDTSSGRHEVAYEYDTLDRVVTRTVNGSDPTTYTYDNAGRPLTIGYRGQSTTYVWDAASRLTSKTLPNGILQELAYDDADRLLSLTYRKTDNSILEQLAYSYDAKGQRLTKSSGTTSVPETPITAVYDQANRLTTLTLTGTGQVFNLAYDDNGNLTTKTEQGGAGAVTNYTWDARNRLTGISAPGLTASFEYDALGRRATKTVNGQTIGFVYDGAQAIGEVTGGTITTAILTTLAIDDVVARYTTQGTRTYLVDALGSVIAQAKDDHSIQNYYGYSAYGEAQTLGPDEGNAIQYTGREVDGTGLMYYRARYYDAVLKRFMSEDPIGLVGGPNFSAFVRGDPVSLTDPNGLMGSRGATNKKHSIEERKCVQDYLHKYYFSSVGDVLVPGFSLFSYAPDSGHAAAAWGSATVSVGSKFLFISVAYAGGQLATLLSGAGAAAGIGGAAGLATTGTALLTLSAGATAVSGLIGAATVPFATAANYMAIVNCSCDR